MSAENIPARPRASQTFDPDGPALFALGNVVATPGAIALMEDHGIGAVIFLKRHQYGDWGNLGAEDRMSNNSAVTDGSRVFSSYDVQGERIWVIPEAVGDDGERASTCILLPEEY